MQLKITLILAMFVSLLIAGCNVGGGFSYPYDGTWTTSYNNAADFPVEGANEKVACTKPAVLMSITKGLGSIKQTLTCTTTTTTPATATTAATVSSVTKYLDYLISISIGETGITSAIVNGYPLEGKCISTVGCSALSASTALSLTR